jgi:hypothetical protein
MRSFLKNLDDLISNMKMDENGIQKQFLEINQNFFNLNLVHPFNIIYEFISLSIENVENEEESKKIRFCQEEVRL